LGQGRREFLKNLGFATAAWTAEPARAEGAMQYRTLGSTGEKVSIVGLGGYHIGNPQDDAEGIRIVRTAIDNGITFMDNCWDYHDGNSEVRMGKALSDGYRQKVFLMTKIDGRDKKTAAHQIEQSLQRLQTDHIDLMQMHEIIRMHDPDRIFAPGGAIEALYDARKAGKIRYIGFTGHKDPEIHLKMLKVCFAHNFTPATVQMPLNPMDAHYDSFEKKVLPVLVEHKIGVLGMKPMGSGVLLKSNVVKPVECLRYALSLPTSVVITGCDSLDMVNQAIRMGRTFQPMPRREMADLLARTAPAAKSGQYELYKTSTQFDGTGHNPQWLG
jgi:aryl-alcohol dehydrogenase-like predicted oxidoreductase